MLIGSTNRFRFERWMIEARLDTRSETLVFWYCYFLCFYIKFIKDM